MKLERYIGQLLKHHNCVIVPDFGGFVANFRSAVIDEHRKKIHPPSKSVLFNPHLVNNDGLLGNYISQKAQITYPEALDFIGGEIIAWKKGFEHGERIEIGEIGFLYRENGIIHFEQSREMNLLLQAYGLKSVDFIRFKEITSTFVEHEAVEVTEKVQIKETQQLTVSVEEKPVKVIEIVDETPVKDKVSKFTKEKVVDKEPEKEAVVITLNSAEEIGTVKESRTDDRQIIPLKRNVGRTLLKYAAAAAFVPVLFYSYWIPMETDAIETSSIQLSDFNPIHEQVKQVYRPRVNDPVFQDNLQGETWSELTDSIDASVYNFELSEDFYVSVSLEKSGAENVIPEQESAVEASKGNYHVIAGCFSVEMNAESLVKELKAEGFSAMILDQSGGLTRVSAGTYHSREAANTGLEKLKGTGKSGWVLRK